MIGTMTKTQFKRKFDREMSMTSLIYLERGSLKALFAKDRARNEKKNLTIWGYEIVEEITNQDLRYRIKYMIQEINNNKWFGRRRQFAVHHLRSLERQLNQR